MMTKKNILHMISPQENVIMSIWLVMQVMVTLGCKRISSLFFQDQSNAQKTGIFICGKGFLDMLDTKKSISKKFNAILIYPSYKIKKYEISIKVLVQERKYRFTNFKIER